MTDYESVYNDALNDESVPADALIDDIHQITHAAGLEAVAATAKAEALEDAAAFLSEPSTTWRGPRGGRIVADESWLTRITVALWLTDCAAEYRGKV